MREIVGAGVAVPEEGGGFSIVRARDSFALEVCAVGAGEVVREGYGGGLVDSHEFGQLGEEGGDQRGRCGRFADGGCEDGYGWVGVCGVASCYC